MGKTDDSYQYPEPDPPDNSAAIAAMMEGMMAMSAQQSSLIQSMNSQQILQPPQIESATTIDWEARRDKLNEQIAYDATKDARSKRGRSSTILTSQLTEDPDTVSSILTGSQDE